MFKKNKIVTFLLSMIVPGVGHLYLGLNKRGLQLLIGTFASIYFIPSAPLIFPFVLAIIWFYGMFDALQQVTYLNYYVTQQHAASSGPSNESGGAQSIEDFEGITGPITDVYKSNTINPLWIGISCVLAGLLVILIILVPDFFSWIFDRKTSSIILAIIMIGIGAGLIYKQIQKRSV